MGIQTIQEMAISSGKTKKSSRIVDLNYNPGGYCWMHRYRVHFENSSEKCRKKRAVYINYSTRLEITGGNEPNKKRKAISA